ncbi:MAG TPA: DnaJ domain-containing protein [Bacillota bacterium]
MTENYYDCLGVDKLATAAEIKQAYRAMMRKWHPDANPGRRELAEERSKAINEAYSILGNSVKRREYDRLMGFLDTHDLPEEIKPDDFWRKLKKASSALAELKDETIILFQMFKDGITGSYHFTPATLGLLAGVLTYLISTFDLLPDFLPLIGFTDDAAFLTMIINHLKEEILHYQIWRKGA